jgi:hypothetical protein
MVRWVQLLLSDTRAYTVVHGHVSKAQTWQAGVRQGCPLSPLLYLLVEEALACWLRQCPELGVLVANQRHVSQHHADDTKVFLSSMQPELVQSLVVRLDAFALASGQRINIAKSCVVPLGTMPPPLQLRRLGWVPSRLWHTRSAWASPSPRLLPSSSSLLDEKGCAGNGASQLWPPPQPSVVWDTRLSSVERLCSRMLGLDLSAMGRGLGTTGYAAAQVWYHAEFEGNGV